VCYIFYVELNYINVVTTAIRDLVVHRVQYNFFRKEPNRCLISDSYQGKPSAVHKDNLMQNNAKGIKITLKSSMVVLFLRSFVVHRRLKSALERQLLKKEHQLVFLRCVGEGLQANNPHCSKQHRLSLQSFTNKQRNIETGS
jgi:hypothetical protein